MGMYCDAVMHRKSSSVHNTWHVATHVCGSCSAPVVNDAQHFGSTCQTPYTPLQSTYRWFVVDDVPMLEEDLHQLRAFFEAGGDGLPLEEIGRETRELEQLLRVMSLSTVQLEQRLDQVYHPSYEGGGGLLRLCIC